MKTFDYTALRVRRVLPLLLLAVLVATPWRRAAAFDEPDGWENAKLGMGEGAFTKAYPKAKSETPPVAPGTNPLLAPFSTYQLEHQKVGPLKDCRIEFRFHLHELYDLQFVCADREAAIHYLQSRFGMPTTTMGSAWMWKGKVHGVSQVPKNGVFSFHDIERGHAAQASMLRMMGQRQQQHPAEPPTPGAAAPQPTPE